MIKKIKIQNFESWKDIEIELHPGINVLIGESDYGKSGIIRALRWNFRNRPQGFSYRSDFLEDKNELTLVESTLDSNDIICRQRNLNGINEYRLNGNPLVALRTDVPDEISEVSKISEINIQGQHPSEQYFLLSERPGYVAKEFNKISGLSIMDDALTEINSQVRSTNAEIKVIEKEIQNNKELIKKNKWIKKAVKFVEKLKKLEEEIISLENLAGEIIPLLINLEKTEDKIQKYEKIPQALKELKTYFTLETEIEQTQKEHDTLFELIFRAKKTFLHLKTTQSIDNALIALKSLEKCSKEIETQEQIYIQLTSILKSLDQNQEKEKALDEEIQKYEKIFHDKLKTEKCPICGRIG
jgi:predicted ATP-dependent endonuclease of OLD family